MQQQDNAAPELQALMSISARPSPDRLSSTAALLARAFVSDPVLCYAEPDAVRRASWLSLLYRGLARYAVATGGMELVDGRAAALWLQNETQPAFWRGLLLGSLRIMLALGWRAAWRSMRHEAWCAARVRALGLRRFGYVWLLGVDPAVQRAGNGRRALESALAAMREHEHDVCILKTETQANVAYYLARGFQLIDEAVVPATQLRYWLFLRKLA
ncbi:MAG: hypothetical protein RL033_2044 [Pseudomonadota bacterium]|jgi:ribosomal protein S18 acetylase RimI-like enzyme